MDIVADDPMSNHMVNDPRRTLFGITEAQAIQQGWRRDEYGEWRLHPSKRVPQPDDPPPLYPPPPRDDGSDPYLSFFYSAARAQAAAKVEAGKHQQRESFKAGYLELRKRREIGQIQQERKSRSRGPARPR
ncbi:MAG: hypothetical protein AAFX39_01720 [Pseudomonadota bacterium]